MGAPVKMPITLAQLRRMRQARMGQTSIAKRCEVNTSTVRYWLVKFGLPTRLPAAKPVSDEQVDRWIRAYRRAAE